MSDHPDHEASVVLHAETARAAVERVVVGAIRVRRVIVIERRTIEVDVAHEELVVERLDRGPDDATGRHRSPTTEPLTIELRAEQVQLVRTAVPTERVVVHVDQVTKDLPIQVALRRETAEAVVPDTVTPTPNPHRPRPTESALIHAPTATATTSPPIDLSTE